MKKNLGTFMFYLFYIYFYEFPNVKFSFVIRKFCHHRFCTEVNPRPYIKKYATTPCGVNLTMYKISQNYNLNFGNLTYVLS